MLEIAVYLVDLSQESLDDYIKYLLKRASFSSFYY